MVMYAGKDSIKVHFWMVIPLYVQWVAIQLQLLVCDTKIRVEISFGKHAFNQ